MEKLPIDRTGALPVQWVDRMEITVRAKFPVAMLRFYSALPEQMIEACRLQTSVDHLKEIINVLCRSVGHYPEKPQQAGKR